MLLRPRVLLLIAIIILVLVVMIVGVTSCIHRNNEKANQPVEETKPKNEQDERVAAGVSAGMTSKFTVALDDGELLATIAQNADQYEDERMLDLALNEPASRSFVAAYPSSDKSSRGYDETVKRGEVPNLYNWDERWGAVTYGNGPLAITGSGPTTLAMAYMGLTGKTDFSPTEIAQQASKSNYADGDSGSKEELFSKLTNSMGLSATSYTPAVETLAALSDTTVFAAELKEGTLTDEAHWVLVVNMNDDDTVTVFDPTSTYVSGRTWDVNTISNASKVLYAISPTEDTLAELEKNSSSSSSSSSSKSSKDESSDTTASEEDAYGTSEESTESETEAY
ncbi:MAG: hypothetical protein Q4B54_14605 [Coriobacteriales bacterium]|nr:hypothetical protein [Coriobacteriales bacterium]